MEKIIATPSRTKELLEVHNLYAKKNFGQNFLVEPGIVDKIARHAIISDHCAVFEIGPGIGALSQFLCAYAKKVIAFEIDPRLPVVLADSLADCENFEVVLEDFLHVDVKAWVDPLVKAGYDVVFAANLPYYITTPILFKLFESKADISAITVMMQKEVADRFGAQVNTKDYNALSVVTQYRCHVQQVMKVPRGVFNPKPNVDSAVLQFTFRKHEKQIDEEAFFEMVKACFKQRRKTMLNNYGEYRGDKEEAKKLMEMAGIQPQARAESLALSEFLQLFEVQQSWK